MLLLPPSEFVPPSEPDATGVPEAPAAALPLLEAPPLEAPPLEAPLLTTPLGNAARSLLPLVGRPLPAPPEELPLAGVPLAVDPPVLPAPETLTEPDDDIADPEAEALLPEDPEPTVAEGVFEPEQARLIVTPTQNNPERHLADMGPP